MIPTHWGTRRPMKVVFAQFCGYVSVTYTHTHKIAGTSKKWGKDDFEHRSPVFLHGPTLSINIYSHMTHGTLLLSLHYHRESTYNVMKKLRSVPMHHLHFNAPLFLSVSSWRGMTGKTAGVMILTPDLKKCLKISSASGDVYRGGRYGPWIFL